MFEEDAFNIEYILVDWYHLYFLPECLFTNFMFDWESSYILVIKFLIDLSVIGWLVLELQVRQGSNFVDNWVLV